MVATREIILEKVRASFKKHVPADFNAEIRIYEKSLRQKEDGSWVVPIYPSRNDVKTYQYYDIVAEVEEELQEQQHLDLFFVPVRPEN